MAARLTDMEARRAKPRATAYKLTAGDGLCLAVMPSGGKYWWLRYRFAGREKTFSIGVYPNVSLKEAEAAAQKARTLLRNDIDPTEDRRARKFALRMSAENTFGGAAELWIKHNTPRWKPATLEKVRQYLDKDLLPSLGRRPLANITPMELGVAVAKIEARKAHNVAKKTRQWLGKIFQFAIAKGMTSTNPAEYLAAVAAAAPQSKRQPHLSPDELPAFLQALDRYPGTPLVKGATWLALWTANRPGITRTLRWSELDLDAALWKVPKGREGMKRGYEHITPLPRQAVAMLRQMHKMTGTFEYVFVNRNDPRSPMSNGAVNAMLRTMGYGGQQTAHGFRHLVSTALNERGYNADWIERQLAHGDPDAIRGTYNEAHYIEDRRRMMQAWADYLDALRVGAAVIPLRRAAQ